MTIGEKNIIAAVLNALQNNDLISQKALKEAFEGLNLPQEYKGIYENNVFDFTTGGQHMDENWQREEITPWNDNENL
ncbi:MAG: hypothetical protein WCS27_16100 [Victivallaceae bacterium]